MKKLSRMEYVTRPLVATLLSLSLVFLISSGAQAAVNCATCHGVLAGDGITGLDALPVDTPPGSLPTYRNITSGAVKGNHSTHAAPTMNANVCTKCHGAAASSYTTKHAVLNHYSIQMAPAVNYNKGAGVVTAFPQTDTPVLGNCSNVACHFNAPTPQWGSAPLGAASLSNTCGTCHNALPTTGSHGVHLTAVGNTLAGCAQCHTDHGAAAKPFQHATSAGRPIAVTSTFNYAGSDNNYLASSGRIYGSCSTATCHADPYSPGLITTPEWGDATHGCVVCHTVPLDATGPATGSHLKHGISDCSKCHATASTNLVAPTANHGNSSINVTNGYPVTAKHAAGTYTGYCTTASCHDNGKGVPAQSPVWGTTAPACTACHALQPADAGHTKHLTGLLNFNRNAACNDCHAGTTQGVVAGAGHLDDDIDVTVGSYPTNKTKNTAAATCTTAACHSNGSAAYKPALWGGTNAAGCNFCHDAVPTSGSHTIHIGGTANYSFGCAECHGHSGIGATHNDGILNVVGSVGYNGSKQCSTSDCHSNGKAVIAYKASPAWGGTFTGDRCAGCHGNWPTGDAHAAHVVGIHYKDVYNTAGGKIATSATVASATNAAHGNSLYSTTISCNICHNTTVTVNYNDNASTCNTAACHGSGGAGGSKGLLTTASLNKTTHVNRSRDVSFANDTIRSKAQLRDDITQVTRLNTYWARINNYKSGASSHDASKATLKLTAIYVGGNCSAVVCHSGNSIDWTAGAISCDKCHTDLPHP